MIPWRHLIAVIGLATVGVGILASAWADERPPLPPTKGEPGPSDLDLQYFHGYPANATDAEKQAVDQRRTKLLAANPFESLEDRLTFDPPGRKRLAKSFPTPDLDLDKWRPLMHKPQMATIPPVVLTMLMVDQHHDTDRQFDRVQALARVHQLEVKRFISSPGFGYARIDPRWNRFPIDTPPTDWSEAERGAEVKLPTTGGFFTASPDKKGPTLPSTMALAGFHASSAHEFARPDSWGLVKDKTQVAGFLPHALEATPDSKSRRRTDAEHPTKDKTGQITEYPLIERWATRKTELIGLLMHDTPVVYLNPDNRLPTMAGIKDAKTRELTEFELGGLKDVAAGKEVVVVDATTNQVRMVGAIRMAAACMKCHDGKLGDLLGAFSYDLVRVPAYVAEQK